VTVLLDLSPHGIKIEPNETICTYEDILKNEALFKWEQVEIGCDIDRPGSSAEFFTGNWRTTGKPVIDREKCIKCGLCWIFCPDMAYRVNDEGYYDWDGRYCKGCGICVEECPKGSIEMREE
jgi:2-oxoacid:acceptor oxidoreductase delta subunit (pyruvate/2-ketoisovalerate family)